MGITEAEDKRWHGTHKLAQEPGNTPGWGPINPFAIGGGFLDYCVKQGWLIKSGTGRNVRYYVTESGEKALKKFDIKV
jgi:hypothetical protein